MIQLAEKYSTYSFKIKPFHRNALPERTQNSTIVRLIIAQ